MRCEQLFDRIATSEMALLVLRLLLTSNCVANQPTVADRSAGTQNLGRKQLQAAKHGQSAYASTCRAAQCRVPEREPPSGRTRGAVAGTV